LTTISSQFPPMALPHEAPCDHQVYISLYSYIPATPMAMPT